MSYGRRLAALEAALPAARRDSVPLTEAEIVAFRLAEAVCVAFHLGDATLPPLRRLYSGIAAGNAASDQCQPYRNTLRGRLSWAVYKLQHPSAGKHVSLADCVRAMPDAQYEALAQSLSVELAAIHPKLLSMDADNSWAIEATSDGRIIANHKDPETAFEITGDLALAFGPRREGEDAPC